MKEKQANIALSRITGKGKEFLSGNAYGKEVFQELLREVDALGYLAIARVAHGARRARRRLRSLLQG